MVRVAINPRGERRERILASATSLFEENGFHGAGIDDIAAAAGVTGPAIYRHFKNKDAVLVALFDRLAERLAAILDTVRSEHPGDAGEERRRALDALVRLHVRLAFEERALIVVYISEERNLPDTERRRVRRFQRAYVEAWSELLRPLRPEQSDDERRTAVHAAIGLLNSTGYRRQVGLPRTQAEAMLARMALVALLDS
ncbi:MAG TPA: TetR/AcrR family transcriptional regulator [Acidimicrobiia bacterium]|jgi:AcrR family transcriptional regulator|nr:TetR/AcrR family transcriptional regulator [Acidimicrobiia bacterium]